MKKNLFRVLGLFALALVITPPAAFLAGALKDESLMKTLMLVGTALWFVAAPVWFRDDAASS